MDSILSQFDIASPDHVSVITRDGKVTVSITKDGSSLTLGFPVSTSVVKPQLQQLQSFDRPMRRSTPTQTKHIRYVGPTPKLTVEQVREIKLMVSDPDIMRKFKSITEAYQEIGKAYKVTGCAISNIARGVSWKHITV
jgi:hypothetical protein